jgi:lysyl-tRNA synthetase class 2
MAMLAKVGNAEPKVAKRFEAYFKGVEIANGYEELTNAKQQGERFLKELEERKCEGVESVPMDVNLLAALEFGMPACSGVALGLDRLLMLITDAASIDDVLSFPIQRA